MRRHIFTSLYFLKALMILGTVVSVSVPQSIYAFSAMPACVQDEDRYVHLRTGLGGFLSVSGDAIAISREPDYTSTFIRIHEKCGLGGYVQFKHVATGKYIKVSPSTRDFLVSKEKPNKGINQVSLGGGRYQLKSQNFYLALTSSLRVFASPSVVEATDVYEEPASELYVAADTGLSDTLQNALDCKSRIAFVVDESGSMGDYMDDVKVALGDIMRSVPDHQWQASLIGARDNAQVHFLPEIIEGDLGDLDNLVTENNTVTSVVSKKGIPLIAVGFADGSIRVFFVDVQVQNGVATTNIKELGGMNAAHFGPVYGLGFSSQSGQFNNGFTQDTRTLLTSVGVDGLRMWRIGMDNSELVDHIDLDFAQAEPLATGDINLLHVNYSIDDGVGLHVFGDLHSDLTVLSKAKVFTAGQGERVYVHESNSNAVHMFNVSDETVRSSYFDGVVHSASNRKLGAYGEDEKVIVGHDGGVSLLTLDLEGNLVQHALLTGQPVEKFWSGYREVSQWSTMETGLVAVLSDLSGLKYYRLEEEANDSQAYNLQLVTEYNFQLNNAFISWVDFWDDTIFVRTGWSLDIYQVNLEDVVLDVTITGTETDTVTFFDPGWGFHGMFQVTQSGLLNIFQNPNYPAVNTTALSYWEIAATTASIDLWEGYGSSRGRFIEALNQVIPVGTNGDYSALTIAKGHLSHPAYAGNFGVQDPRRKTLVIFKDTGFYPEADGTLPDEYVQNLRDDTDVNVYVVGLGVDEAGAASLESVVSTLPDGNLAYYDVQTLMTNGMISEDLFVAVQNLAIDICGLDIDLSARIDEAVVMPGGSVTGTVSFGAGEAMSESGAVLTFEAGGMSMDGDGSWVNVSSPVFGPEIMIHPSMSHKEYKFTASLSADHIYQASGDTSIQISAVYWPEPGNPDTARVVDVVEVPLNLYPLSLEAEWPNGINYQTYDAQDQKAELLIYVDTVNELGQALPLSISTDIRKRNIMTGEWEVDSDWSQTNVSPVPMVPANPVNNSNVLRKEYSVKLNYTGDGEPTLNTDYRVYMQVTAAGKRVEITKTCSLIEYQGDHLLDCME